MSDLATQPADDRSQGEQQRRRRSRSRGKWKGGAALLIFAIIVMGAPLAFGSVDRPVQICLLGALAAGLVVKPATWVSGRVRWFWLASALLLLLAQLGPWQTATLWRSVLGEEYGVVFPATRHPEPFRVLDAMLAAAGAVVWFAWVRTLAADRESRVKMFWILAAAGVAVAAVCFALKGVESGKIYGIRSTPGWIGWGPFPNRNHTASFLAMAALVTVGVTAWSMARRLQIRSVLAGLSFALVVSALLFSKSRGGLLAFGVGMVVFVVAVLVRNRNPQTRWIVLGFTVVTAVLVMAFGGSVLARFTSQDAGLVSNDLRRQIWSDTVTLWKDAPLLGHGFGVFAEVFPIYTRHDFDGQIVRHPESSWLLWLSEVGAIPVVIAVLAALWFAGKGLRNAWQFERRAFYLTSGAVAGVAVLLAHAAIDVPAHRWGTAVFALALAAVAFPAAESKLRGSGRWLALVPASAAALWAYAFQKEVPWSPVTSARLEARESVQREYVHKPQVPLRDWMAVLQHFPMDPLARHYAGLGMLATRDADANAADRHLAIARRLSGSSWGYSMMQARAFGARFPSYSILAWQDAVLRAGRRSREILRGAMGETVRYPGYWVLWGQFVEKRPEFFLSAARAIGESLPGQREQARGYFERWREERPISAAVSKDEAEDLQVAARWFADAAFLREWIAAHPERLADDYRVWARLFLEWSEAREAWDTYARAIQESPLGDPPLDSRLETLESQYRASPENPHIALAVAQHYGRRNEKARAEELILKHADKPDAPVWFIRKGAHILAGRSQFPQAVALALREK